MSSLEQPDVVPRARNLTALHLRFDVQQTVANSLSPCDVWLQRLYAWL